MKKTGLFKIVMFILLGIVVATWIFSASYFSNGAVSDIEMYNIGFFDFWQLLFGSFEFSYFIQIFILILSVGALYGVLVKTGKYRAWIDNIAKSLRGNEFMFLAATAIIIALLSSVFDYGYSLFIFYPLIISVILAMGYDKFTALLATFGAQLVGTIGSTLGNNTAGVVNGLIGAASNNAIFAKIALLAAAIGVLLYFLAKAKRNKLMIVQNTKDDMFAGEKLSNKYSNKHIVVVLIILFVLLVLGCTAWKASFKVEAFDNFKTNLEETQVKLPYFHITATGFDYGSKKIAIFSKLLGTFSAFGNWYYAEMAVMCFLAALILGLRYRVKNVFESMGEGAKKMLRPALLVMFIYTVIYFAGNTMFYPTIAKFILNITGKFNLFFATITMAIASALHVDMLYVSNYAIPQIAAMTESKEVVGILTQGVYGVTMLAAPTSAVLALGLSYLGITYKDWMKKSWKLILCLLALVLIACIICTLAYK